MKNNNQTLEYYAQNAESFVAGTVGVDLSENCDRFLSYIRSGGKILDFGCGSGRDSRYFLEKGYEVDAVDGSAELCALAAKTTGLPVKNMLFTELSEVDTYDGIWACASILHLSKKELPSVIRKMITALKQNGTIYTSFKYGTFEGERNGRYFTDFTEEFFQEMISEFSELTLKEQWITGDARPGRSDERWLNVILQKN